MEDQPKDNDVQIWVKGSTKNKLESMAKRHYKSIDETINMLFAENEELRHQIHINDLYGNFAKTIVSKKNSTAIPSVIRHQFGIEPGNIILWDVMNGQIILSKQSKKQ